MHIYVSPSIDTLRKYKEKDTGGITYRREFSKKTIFLPISQTRIETREEIFGKSSSSREARRLSGQVFLSKRVSRNRISGEVLSKRRGNKHPEKDVSQIEFAIPWATFKG